MLSHGCHQTTPSAYASTPVHTVASENMEHARKEIRHVILNITGSLDRRKRTELAQIVTNDVQQLLGTPMPSQNVKPWRNVIKTAICKNHGDIIDILNCAFQSLKEHYDEHSPDLKYRNKRLRDFCSTYFSSLVSSWKTEEDNMDKCTNILGIPDISNGILHHQPLSNIFADALLPNNSSRRCESGSADRHEEITTTFQHSPDRTSEIPSSSSETSDEFDSGEGAQKERVTSSLERSTLDNPNNDSTPTGSRLISGKEGKKAEHSELTVEIREEQSSLDSQRRHELNLERFGEVNVHVCNADHIHAMQTISSEPSIEETAVIEPSPVEDIQHFDPNEEESLNLKSLAIMDEAGNSNGAEPNTQSAERAETAKRETSPESCTHLVQSSQLHEKNDSAVKVDLEMAEIVEELGIAGDETVPDAILTEQNEIIETSTDSRDATTANLEGKNSDKTSPTSEPVELQNNLDGGETESQDNSSANNPLPEQPLIPQEQSSKVKTMPRRSVRDRKKVTRDGSIDISVLKMMKTPEKSTGRRTGRSRTRRKAANQNASVIETTPESITSSEGTNLRSDSSEIDVDLPFISNPDLYKTVSGADEVSQSKTPKKPQRKRRRQSAVSQKQASEPTTADPDPKINEPLQHFSVQSSTRVEPSIVHSSWNGPPLEYGGNSAIDFTNVPNYNWTYPHSNYYYGQNTSHGPFQTSQHNATAPSTGCDFGFQPSLDGYPEVSLNYPQYLHSFNNNPESSS